METVYHFFLSEVFIPVDESILSTGWHYLKLKIFVRKDKSKSLSQMQDTHYRMDYEMSVWAYSFTVDKIARSLKVTWDKNKIGIFFKLYIWFY